MILSNYQISMIPLCSDMLFKLVDYIFVICLTKCLSWLVGVKSIPCHCFFKCIIFMLCKFISESVIEFWVVTWALGLKSVSNPRDADKTRGIKFPRRMHTHVVGESKSS